MRFWRITYPEYESDYKLTYINRTSEHPFGLPGVRCEVCGKTWGGSRILPYTCPAKLQKRVELRERWPISGEKHRKLRNEVKGCLQEDGCVVDQLKPGDSFQPVFLSVSSNPNSDFLWSTTGSVIVSERIKAAFGENGFTGVQYCPVTFKRVGKRSAKLPPPMPSTGEPEDIVDEVLPIRDMSGVGRYYEMVVETESGLPPGLKVKSICELCGCIEYDPETRRFTMNEDMWNGRDILFLSTTALIIITDRVREQLAGMRATNIRTIELG